MKKEESRAKVLDAFKSLRKQGFLARANFLGCQNCAGYDLTIQAEKKIEKGETVNGCVFWHSQDEENYKEDGCWYLAFGDLNSTKYGKIGFTTEEVGKVVIGELKKRDVEFEWDGTPGSRILIKGES